jgi:hypothetical protein
LGTPVVPLGELARQRFAGRARQRLEVEPVVRRAVERDPAPHAAALRARARQRGTRAAVGDHRGRGAVVDDAGDLVLVQPPVDRHAHRAELGQREVRLDVLDAVARHHGDALAAREAQLLEPARDPTATPRELAERARARSVAHGLGAGVQPSAAPQQVRDQHRAITYRRRP